MNRSTARATAISRVVAAGLVSAGLTLSGAALASADPRAGPGGHSGPSRDGAQQSLGALGGLQASRRQERPMGSVQVNPRLRFGPAIVAENEKQSLAVAPTRRAAPGALLPPVEALPDQAADGLIDVAVATSPAPLYTAPPAVVFSQGDYSVGALPQVMASSPVLDPVARATGPVSPPAAAPLAVGSHPEPASGIRLPSHVPVPADLNEQTLSELALMALPGLAVLVAVTGFGIMIGQRNAKSAYVLQSMGTTRFLQ